MPAKKFDKRKQAAVLKLHDLRTDFEKMEEKMYLVNGGIIYQQYVVLLTVHSMEPPVSQASISRAVNRTFNSVSSMVERMEEQGLVVRARSKTDRREVHVALTDLGERMLADAIKIWVPLTDGLSSVFSDKELGRMKELMNKLQAGIAAELGPAATDPSDIAASRDRIMATLKSASGRA
jgi:DNA-binding MarR family transcriptional regulator